MDTPGENRPSGWWFPARTTAYFLVVAALCLGTLSLLGLRQINSTNEMNSAVRIDRAGRAAAALLDTTVETTVRIDSQGSPQAIIMQDPALLEPDEVWDELLDDIAGVNQGAANLFRYDEDSGSFDRLSTTFRTPDGARVGGSQVEPGLISVGHPAYAALSSGTTYVGQVPVAGRLRLAYLTPILTTDGTTAGILAVDVGWVDDLNRITEETTDRAIATSLSLLAALALICVLVMFRSFRPLHRLTEAAHAIGTGDHDQTIGLTDRRDEIGYLARGLVKVSDLQRTLEHRAYNDSLTAVPNRAALVQELDRRFAQLDGNNPDSHAFALLIIDLDGFKEVNDGLGHQAGDELLVALARSLCDSLEPGEYFARLGGDEFALLSATSPNIDDHVAELAERASIQASGVFSTSAGDACVSASIGVAVIPEHGTTSTEAMRNADLALYEVKRGERGTSKIYEPAFADAFDRQLYLVAELRRVLDDEELTVVYQPIYDMDGNVRALEGLARWHDANGGPVSPAEFIPIAENVGLIDQLGSWVLERACRQITEWSATYDELPRVSINVSTLQLRNPDFVRSIAHLMERYPAAQGQLCLELTESVLVPGQGDWHQPILAALTDMGICLSIDDFGTGYSSLNYLHKLVVDQVKIDRTFIDAAIEDNNQHQLLAGIVAIGKDLGLSVVLEGIETVEELELAQTLGCDLLQGYLLGKPMSPAMAAARFGVPHHHLATAPSTAA